MLKEELKAGLIFEDNPYEPELTPVVAKVVEIVHPPVEVEDPLTSPSKVIVFAAAKASATPALVALPLNAPLNFGETNN
jgi:hypothetical protein